MIKEKFDFVHDIQKVYRNLLDSMSKPGVINNIKNEVDKLDVYSDLSKGLMTLSYTLLNIESKFYTKDENDKNYIKLRTLGKSVGIEKAEFIIMDIAKYTKDEILSTLEKVQIGTLEDPHLGATVVIKTSNLSNDKKYILKGPGIKDMAYVDIEGIDMDFFNKRTEIMYEYPLGFDLIFIDSNGNLLCLPRTTKVEVNN